MGNEINLIQKEIINNTYNNYITHNEKSKPNKKLNNNRSWKNV
jgi:hypothetical protein